MGMAEKLEAFLQTKNENYLESLKTHFFERLYIDKGNKLDSAQLEDKFTADYITSMFVEVPGGVTDFFILVDDFIEPVSDIVFDVLAEYFAMDLEDSFIEQHKSGLDQGTDKALIALINLNPV